MQGPQQEFPEGLASGVTGLDEVLRPARSRRATLLRFGATALALGVAGAVLLAIFAPPSLLPSFRGGTRTTQKAIPTADFSRVIVLQTNVDFGLFLNGKPLQITDPQGLVPVAPGKNVLTFKAPPFSPLSCFFVWPVVLSTLDSDPNAPCVANGTQSGDGLPGKVAVVNFLIPMQNIPSAQMTNLQATMQQQLTLAATPMTRDVPIGNYIPYAFDAQGLPRSRATTQPLRARLTATLRGMNDWYGCNASICPGIMRNPLYSNEPSLQIMSFAIDPQFSWQFITADGHIISSLGVSVNTAQTQFPLLIDFAFDAGSWQVTSPPTYQRADFILQDQITSSLCGTTQQEIQGVFNDNNQGIYSTSNNNPTSQGCLIAVSNGTGTRIGTLISRFGALLAANAGAHKLLPTLPIAPPDEVAALAAG